MNWTYGKIRYVDKVEEVCVKNQEVLIFYLNKSIKLKFSY